MPDSLRFYRMVPFEEPTDELPEGEYILWDAKNDKPRCRISLRTATATTNLLAALRDIVRPHAA